MIEQWSKWHPIENLSEKYYIESIIDHMGDICKILLADSNQRTNKILVTFQGSGDGYRLTHQDLQVSIKNMLKEQYGISFYEQWTFFRVTHSDYIQWLSKESGQWSDNFGFQHFVLFGSDVIVDIISSREPKVEFING